MEGARGTKAYTKGVFGLLGYCSLARKPNQASPGMHYGAQCGCVWFVIELSLGCLILCLVGCTAARLHLVKQVSPCLVGCTCSRSGHLILRPVCLPSR